MLRSLLTVSGFTLMSRILGIVRDILIASFIGTSVVSDAFFAAFRFPNMFRRIFGEGAFNSAFIPLFGKRLVQDGHHPALQFANNAFSILFYVLGALTLAFIPLMGWLMLAVVPGFRAGYDTAATQHPQHFRIALKGTREVWIQAEGKPGQIHLENLQVVERGTPPPRQLIAEIFGGPTVAGGPALPLSEATGLADWSFPQNGFLKIPLPAHHRYAVIEGDWSGAPDNALRIFTNDPGAFALATKLSRITFVYLLCMALVAHMGGVLNTLKKFAAPAFAPVLLNFVFLAGLFLFVRGSSHKGEVLAWCVALAGVLQLAFLWWVCRRSGLEIGLVRPSLTPDTRRLFLLMGPGIVAAGIQQVNLMVGNIIASFQQGAISYLYYSDRIYQLPLGLIGIAFGVVLLPEITRLLKQNDEAGAERTMLRGLELSMLITLPATVAIALIPGPIIATLFQHGDFTAHDTRMTSLALVGFTLGLPGYVLIKVLQPGYFAREDTKRPMYMAGATVLVNIVCSLGLFLYIGHIGIALATSIAAWFNVFLLWHGLRRKLRLGRESLVKLRGILVSCLAMAVVLWLGKRFVLPLAGESPWLVALALALVCALAGFTYVAAVLRLKTTSLAELKASFRR